MKTFFTEAAFSAPDGLIRDFTDSSSLFFDIETTGFSPKYTKVYLIGCAYPTGDTLRIHQFFSEDPRDEAEIIQAFFSLMKDFSTLITFNGMGFDLPYLKERCHLLELPERLDSYTSLDLFKIMSPLKKILKLSNMKQKTIESFLGIDREDRYTGGELINIYQDYLASPSEKSLNLMQLHNYEDVKGMLCLLPALSYIQFFRGNFEISSLETHTYEEFEGSRSLELLFTLHPSYELPKRISFGKKDIYLSGYGSQVKLKVKIYQGELKYFYSNYKDYYYLPQEDYAIHKSVAFYVDKNYRTRAKAATCYSKKTGCFLPQQKELFSPYFKLEYHDKISYFEMTNEFTNHTGDQKKYVLHLLDQLIH